MSDKHLVKWIRNIVKEVEKAFIKQDIINDFLYGQLSDKDKKGLMEKLSNYKNRDEEKTTDKAIDKLKGLLKDLNKEKKS